MIIVTAPTATEEQIERIVERVHEFGLEAQVNREGARIIVGVIGPEPMKREKPLAAMPGVESVFPASKPYRLAAREARPAPSTVDICGLSIGAESAVALICGPCSSRAATASCRSRGR
jgi:3-deoxy-7-phosphoheptulonate synthase